MRAYVLALVPFAIAYVACALPKLETGSDDATAASSTDAGVTSDAGFVGGGCGTETNTGAQLCIATTMCPTLVVDTQAMPHCGFRLRNGVPDLVCTCGTSICSMGIFDTCEQAQDLLQTQTEASVCSQIAEGRCLEVTAPAPTTPPPVSDTPSASSSSSSTGGGGGTGCDQQCVKDCGGGAACASVCNCG